MSARERAREARERFERLQNQSKETLRKIADVRWELQCMEEAISEYLENRAADEALEISAAAFPEITPGVGSEHLLPPPLSRQRPEELIEEIQDTVGVDLPQDMKRRKES